MPPTVWRRAAAFAPIDFSDVDLTVVRADQGAEEREVGVANGGGAEGG